MRAFVAAAADARYVALPQATARVAALQAAATALVYDVLMLRVRCDGIGWFCFESSGVRLVEKQGSQALLLSLRTTAEAF